MENFDYKILSTKNFLNVKSVNEPQSTHRIKFFRFNRANHKNGKI